MLADPRTTAAAHRALVLAIETNRFDILRYFLRHNAGIEAPPGARALGRMRIVMTLAAAAVEPASEAAARPTKKAASPKRRR